MHFLQYTAAERAGMLAALGARSLEDLLSSSPRGIPRELRFAGPLALDAGLSENELLAELTELSSWNSPLEQGAFLGAGLYRHYVPTVVDSLPSRREFVAELMGMEVAHACMHDGASAAAEAVRMASSRLPKRKRVVVSRGVHPHTRRCIETYLRWTDLDIVEAPLASDGRTEFAELVNDETCAVLVQNPNTHGVLENIDDVAAAAKACGAISICSAYPVALGLLKSPGAAGFDIAVGDGQCLGKAIAFGGSSVGLFACTQEFADAARELAMSEAARNTSGVLRAATYLAAAGPEGLAEVARHCMAKAQYAASALSTLAGFELPFAGSGCFNEFVLRCPVPAATVNRAIDRAGMIGGLNLARWYPELGDKDLLLSFTELTTRAQIDALVSVIAKISDAKVGDLAADSSRSKTPQLPELEELDWVRRDAHLSQASASTSSDRSPEVNERIAKLPGFADIHPEQDAGRVQGALGMMKRLEHALAEITGLPCVSLQPATRAQRERAALLIAKAHFQALGQSQRTQTLVLGSAHSLDLASQLSDQTAVVMISHSSALGFFDTNIAQVCAVVHEAGALVCMDGAHLHTIMGIARPADLGVDMQLIDLHKSFATPSGGGGPICVRQELERFLPSPRVVEEEEGFHLDYGDAPDALSESIGMLRSWAGNFEEILRAYANLRRLGAEGLQRVAEDAVLQAHFQLHNPSKS